MADQEAGQRIARTRRRRGMSQAVLAGLVGRSESWLSQVERGKRVIDAYSVLARLAEVLRVDITELTQQPAAALSRPRPDVAGIEQAMMRYQGIGQAIARAANGRPWDARNLLGRIKTAYCLYQETRYEETSRLLPVLITEAEAVSHRPGIPAPLRCKVRALVYDTTAALLNRVGEHELAWVAADRAMSAAQQAEETPLAGLGAYRLSYVLAGRKHPDTAVEVAMKAAEAMEHTPPTATHEHLSVYGGLHLAAASAAATGYDPPLAFALLRNARTIAERFGTDANVMGTAFGPVNVAIHSLSVAVHTGDAKTAVRIGESLDPGTMPVTLIGRRTQIHLDLARAYAMQRLDAAAVNMLLAAERLSPQLVRFDARTHDLIAGLLRREHRISTPQLRPLAHRAGIV
jgi:transcriptional regulator with XRE-family HTH domain